MKRNDIKWNTGTNLHVTLLFLGNIDGSLIPKIINTINDSYLVEPFKISIESTGVFPNQLYPKIFWLGIKKGSQYIEGLHNSLEKNLKQFITIKNNNLFVPHITIGRAKSAINYKKLNRVLEGCGIDCRTLQNVIYLSHAYPTNVFIIR